MSEWNVKSKRKASGGLYRAVNRSDKRKSRAGGFPTHPKWDAAFKEEERAEDRILGGGSKTRVKKVTHANVAVKGKVQKVKIENVTGNAADKQLVRQNVLTKGSVVKTELGSAKVTSRPGQDGTVNAVLLEASKA